MNFKQELRKYDKDVLIDAIADIMHFHQEVIKEECKKAQIKKVENKTDKLRNELQLLSESDPRYIIKLMSLGSKKYKADKKLNSLMSI